MIENLFSKAIADSLYQVILVSGTNIKTINGISLLGSGDIVVSGGAGSWGGITGTLSNQTDLQSALDAKASTAAVAAGYQPLDSDLTAIAALATTSTGRALLTESVSPTGSGALVRATSATLVTPSIGAATGTSLSVTTIAIGSSGQTTVNSSGQLTVGGTQSMFGPAGAGRCYFNNSAGWQLGSGIAIGVSPNVDAAAAASDTSLSRASAGVWQMGTTSNNALGSLNLTNLTASGLLCGGIYTVATLPTASTNSYKFANVSDSSVTTFGSTVSGGGSSKVMVRSNGTNWTVFAI